MATPPISGVGPAPATTSEAPADPLAQNPLAIVVDAIMTDFTMDELEDDINEAS